MSDVIPHSTLDVGCSMFDVDHLTPSTSLVLLDELANYALPRFKSTCIPKEPFYFKLVPNYTSSGGLLCQQSNMVYMKMLPSSL